MMSTDIVNEIAHLIRQRDVTLKGPKEVKEIRAQSGLAGPQDAVQLSKAGEAYAHAPVSTSEYEKEQGMKVERLKALVSTGNYKMDPKMVENIAERITNMLL
jgi:anti-sigma28 factor (negative regulator of flagellin synthesis)